MFSSNTTQFQGVEAAQELLTRQFNLQADIPTKKPERIAQAGENGLAFTMRIEGRFGSFLEVQGKSKQAESFEDCEQFQA
ncbi:hypothetical protein GH714_024078 [Hevea brasiliensis]|uniref:Uncharacterized protein n=1 Tax=Hevea brasiliensis TaxID=3981 RepID=A0A6A6L7P2_HEVBR|nr:hypothetical protein GH714_023814 [Hevea brasiliensis]KAF2297472.1 hypothetical protein GH714_024078 [Hevea brasiliensis]